MEKRIDYLSWDEYFMGIAFLSALRSKDPSTQVGACIVDEDKKIIGIGYNGFPMGSSDDDLSWDKTGEYLDTKYPYVVHAELNAILNSTKSLKNCTIYVALFPCHECSKAIIQSGIRELVYLSDKYDGTESNIASKKIGSKIQVVATIAKLIPIVIIIAFGFIKGTVGGVSEVSKVSLSGASLAGFGSAILGTLWAYDGWVGVANMAGELKNPSKDLPKSIILGLSITMIIYVLINIAIINVIPVDAVIASQTPASDAAVLMFGKSGAILISAGIMISIFGAMNGYLLTGVRVPFAMASEGLFPFADKLSYLHPQSNTPVLAFVLEGALAVLYVMSGSFEVLTTLAMFMVWFFFVMAVAGIFVLRKKFSHLNPAYKVPFYPFVPLVGIAGGIYILLSTLVTDFKTAVLGILITALGVPVYNHITKSKRA